MKKESTIKKIARVLALSLVLSLTIQVTAPVSNVIVASAATKVKLNVTKKSLSVGDSFTLKINGISKKVTFSSNKKLVAAVNAKGVVVAKQKGNAVITASVGGSKYVCKVTVKESKMVANAPFPAVEVKINGGTVVMPKAWTHGTQTVNSITAHAFVPKDLDLEYGVIALTSLEGDVDNANFDYYMEALKDTFTVDYMKGSLLPEIPGDFTVEDFSITEERFPLGRVCVVSCTVKQDEKTLFTQKIYNFFAEGYMIQFWVVDEGLATTPSISEVASYMMKSLTLTK